MTNTEILGNKLYELRKEARLSQEEFADKIGVSRQAVSKWERGETLPDMDNLITIAKLFKTSLDGLIDNETTTNLNENSKDLVNEGYIPGTNYLRPRKRRNDESNEEYVQYLQEFYDNVFGHKRIVHTR